MSDQEEYLYIVQPRLVDRDDVNQEAALFEFLNPGKRANRGLIAKKLSNEEPAATFSGDPTSISCPLPSYITVPNPHVIRRLIEWSMDHSDQIQEAVLSFLDEPSEEALAQTLDVLAGAGLIETATREQKSTTKTSGTGFVDALLRLFEKEPEYHIQDLYKWARAIHSAKRPEATLRQALRRLVNNQILMKVGETYRRGEGNVSHHT